MIYILMIKVYFLIKIDRKIKKIKMKNLNTFLKNYNKKFFENFSNK